MVCRSVSIAVMAGTLLCSALLPQRRGISESDFNRWLKEEVTWIISKSELRESQRLETGTQRQQFVENFWRIRDPTPETEQNEYRETHYQRLEVANREFREGGAGWRSDRGRVYILHGAPISRNRQRTQEVWTYNANPYGEYYKGAITLVFAQGASSFQATQLSDTVTARNRNAPSSGPAGFDIPTDLGVSSDYRLIVAGPVNELSASANEVVPGRGPASERLLSGTVESERYVADILRSPGELLKDQEQERQRHLQALDRVRARMLANPGEPGDLRLNLESRIFRQDQVTGLHFSVSIPAALEPIARSIGKKPKKGRKDQQPAEILTVLVCEVLPAPGQARDSLGGTLDAQPGKELVFSGWFELEPGDSRVQCLAGEPESDRSGWAWQEIEIPPLEGSEVSLSGLLLTTEAVRLAENHLPLPLVFQDVQFRVPPLARFLSGPLFLYFQVFNGTDESGAPKELHYDYSVQAEGRSVLSSLPLIRLEGGEVIGSTVSFARSVDFATLSPGKYQLLVRLLEEGSRRPATQKVNFEIFQDQP